VKEEETSKSRFRLSIENSKETKKRQEGKKRGKGTLSFLFSYIYIPILTKNEN
jgi:hypothetical protein